MKKYLLIGLFIFCLFNIDVNASTKTFTRTEDNLLLPSWVKTDEVRKDVVLKTPAVDPNEKIYDFAEYISDGDELKLYTYAKEYVSHTNYDIVILTVKDLNGMEPLDYMYNFYDYNSFDRNGIILMVYKNGSNNEVYIGTTKYGSDSKIEAIYTRAYIKGMVDHIKGRFKTNSYYEGFHDFIKLGIGIYDIQTNDNGNYRVNQNGELVKNIYWLDYLIISIAITSIVVVVLIYINSLKTKKNIVKDYLNKSTLVVNKVSEEVVDNIEK